MHWTQTAIFCLQILLIIAYVIGVVIISKIQHKQIDSLRNQLELQNKLIGEIKSFMDIFDIKKVKEYVDTTEELQRMTSDKLISEV